MNDPTPTLPAGGEGVGRPSRVWLAALLVVAAAAMAQEPVAVPVGAGSYASLPPAHEGDGPQQMLRRQLYIVDQGDRPIPTNAWWTDLIVSRYCGSLWPLPLNVRADERGLKLFFPTRWNEQGTEMVSDAPLEIGGLQPADARAKDWSDWLVTMRLGESAERYWDVTLGHGLPSVWLECHGADPTLRLPGDARTFGEAPGQLGLVVGGRTWGLFGPEGTRFERQGGELRISFSGAKHYLSVSALPAETDLALFARHAHAIPRDSRVDWEYDAAKGEVRTTWHLTTEALQGTERRVLQGWLPHHWRRTTHDLAFAGPEYASPRGRLRLALGTDFHLAWPFRGVLPWLPPGKPSGLPHDFDATRMAGYQAKAAQHLDYGADTYWGGKSLTQVGEYLQQARQLGDPSAAALRGGLRRALADWYTYTPGEKEHYFARYPNWHALIGFNESYGSYQFTDNHFHYGYYTLATAQLGLEDPAFLAEYGPMARLVAKQYANWDRADHDFPFLRTFDLWSGHSWAGGFSSPGGNNQESTSEAVQSWAGLTLLGAALHDSAMESAGVMGYAMETESAREYWLNEFGDVLPKAYKPPIGGILFAGGQAYATYFSGDPAWIFGIQWLPAGPWLSYLGDDLAFGRRSLQTMLAERQAKEGNATLASMGGALGNVILAHAAQLDPDWAAEQADVLWEAKDPVARDTDTAGLSYYLINAWRRLGRPDPHWRLASATAQVFWNERTQTRTFVVDNPLPYPVALDVYDGERAAGLVVAPARQLSSSTALLPRPTDSGLLSSVPATGATAVSRYLDRLYLLTAEPVTPAALAGTTLTGPSAPALGPARVDGRTVTLPLAGRLRVGADYTLTLPAALTKAPIRFSVEPQPPLAVTAARPADGESRVPLELRTITLTFNDRLATGAAAKVRLAGPGVTGLTPQPGDGESVTFTLGGTLQPDEEYRLVLPAGLAGVGGQTLAAEQVLSFTTVPPPCPPTVYADSFAGGGLGKDDSVTVDWADRTQPHSGRAALKLSGGEHDGTLYLFAGTSDHGDGRVALDLSRYRRLSFWLRGVGKDGGPLVVWAKIGHPVFDQKAFAQARLEGVGATWRQFSLPVPEPRSQIGTLLAISVPAGGTVWVDDARFETEAP